MKYLQSKGEANEDQVQIQESNNIVQYSTRQRADFIQQRSSRILGRCQLIRSLFLIIKSFMKIYGKYVYGSLIIFLMIYIQSTSKMYKDFVCPFQEVKKCVQQFIDDKKDQLRDILIKVFINSLIFMIYFEMLVKKATHFILPILAMIQFIWIHLLGDYLISFKDISGGPKIGHLTFTVVLFILYGIMHLAKFILKRKNKLWITLIIIAIIGLAVFIGFNSQRLYYKKGINGQILQFPNLCPPALPSFCIMYFLNLVADFSPVMYHTSIGQKYRQILNQYIPNQQKGDFIAFEPTKKFILDQRTQDNLQTSVFNHAKRFQSLEEAQNNENKYQVILDNINQKYHIKVHRNESLLKERKILFQKAANSSSPPLAKNILFIFFDSISRAEAHLQLPLSFQWFKQTSKYQSYLDIQPNNIHQSKDESYEFYRYNSIGYTTIQNIQAIEFGLPYKKKFQKHNQYFQNSDLLWKEHQIFKQYVSFLEDFQQKGFIVGSSASDCMNNGRIWAYTSEKISKLTPDHETHSFACDPNFQRPNFRLNVVSGSISASDRNLYGRKMSQYAYKYALSFFEAYKDVPKIHTLTLMEGHDFMVGSTKRADEPLRKFLNQFEQRGFANDTVVVLVSDHGHHVVYKFQDYKLEHYRALLTMRLPASVNKRYRQNIRKNQQQLITPWNIYHTMEHLLSGDEYQQVQMSLFSNLDFQKTCQDAKIPIQPPEICTCRL